MSTIFSVLVAVVLVLAILEAVLAYRRSRSSSLYTRNGSPVNVDQVAEQRRKDLLIFQAMKSPTRPRAAGLTSDRRALLRAVSLGDRRES